MFCSASDFLKATRTVVHTVQVACEANKFLQEYLPEYNRRFTVKPKEEDNLHREVPKGMKLDGIVCIKTERVLRNDFTISYSGRLYQVMDKTNARKIIAQERINGTMAITHNGNRLRLKKQPNDLKKSKRNRFFWLSRRKKLISLRPITHGGGINL